MRRAASLWAWALKRLGLHAHRGPGWLSYEIHASEKNAKRLTPLPSHAIRSQIAAPRARAVRVLILAFFALLVLSLIASTGDVEVSTLPDEATRLSVFTAMWQVQAGIAALALPVLTFVIERARDERQAALHTAEVLGRESWSFPIIGFSFVVLARMGVDLTFFPDEQLVFISDVLLFLLTVAAALFAYYRVMRVTLSPSLLRARSIALAQEKTRAVLLQSIRVRLGDTILFTRLDALGVGYWPFGSDQDPDYVVLEHRRVGSVQDVHLDRLENFVAALPWEMTPAQSSPQPLQPTAAIDPSDRSVWVLFRYGTRLTDEYRGLVRLRRASFGNLSAAERRSLEERLQGVVQVGGVNGYSN